MIVLTNTIAQTLSAGESLTFDEVILHSGCGECHRKGTGSVKLRSNGVYELYFGGNVGGETAGTAVQLAMQIGGETLPETLMISVPAATDDLNHISASTLLKNCCGDYDRVTLTNTGDAPIIIGEHPVFYVKRVS